MTDTPHHSFSLPLLIVHFILVTKQLVKSHDVNFGVRSVLYEVEKMAVRLIAEAQIRGDIGQG